MPIIKVSNLSFRILSKGKLLISEEYQGKRRNLSLSCSEGQFSNKRLSEIFRFGDKQLGIPALVVNP